MKKFPTLYHLGKNKALYSWEVYADGDTVYSSTGQVDGQRVLSSVVVTQKNVGKANETSLEEQAEKEAEAKWKFKLDRKYSLTPDEAKEEDIAPMLAQSFEKRKDRNVYYPADIQPKHDGARALAKWDGDKIVLTSRGSKEWVYVKHINDELSKVLPKESVLDGELYIHGVDFQTLISWMKKEQPDNIKIEFHVYDMPVYLGNPFLAWETRQADLINFFKDNHFKHLKLVESVEVISEADVAEKHASFVEQGYEGAMLRLKKGLYDFGKRSYDLLKVKSFNDDEFLVVGVESGIGKFSKCAIFICENKNNQKFKAVPKFSQEEKEKMLLNSNEYIGRLATINYFGLSTDGIPRFPVLKGFRPLEDIDLNNQ